VTPGSGGAVPCTTEQRVLGEGARWDARRDELLAVDIVDGLVLRGWLGDAGQVIHGGSYHVAATVGAVAPIDGDEGWLVAADRSFVHLSPDGAVRPLAEVSPAGTRFNDGACDPQGRFWAGTLAEDHHPGAGALFRLDRDGHVEQVLDALTISNGLGWSPDGRTMYLIDSGPRVIHAFSFDADAGTIADGSVLVTVPDEIGTPDGMTVDAAGDLWVAIYGGGCIHRYSHNGALRQSIHVPAAQVTSCAFAGPGLHRLYITTATENWTAEQRRAEPSAGLVYWVDTDAVGRPAALFRPDPQWWATATG